MATLDEQIQDDLKQQRSEIDKQIADQREFQKRQQEEFKVYQAETKPYYEETRRAEEEYSEASKQIPTLKDIPTPPNTEKMLAPTNLQKTFGMAAVFALLAAGLTKDRSMAGLSALGGFMKGAREGNLERANAAMVDFNNNMRAAIATNEQSLKQYSLIMASKRVTLEEKERLLKLKMGEFQDQLFLNELEQKGMNAVYTLQNQRANLDFHMLQQVERMQQFQENLQMHKENLAETKRYHDLLAGKTTGAGGASQTRLELNNLMTSYDKQIKDLDTKRHKGFMGMMGAGLTRAEENEYAELKRRRDAVRTKLAELAQTPEAGPGAPAPGAPGLPRGGTTMKGKIMVRRKSDGAIGPISEDRFNPSLYEKIPEGVTVVVKPNAASEY